MAVGVLGRRRRAVAAPIQAVATRNRGTLSEVVAVDVPETPGWLERILMAIRGTRA